MIEPARRIKQLPPYLFAEIDRQVREKVAAGVDVIRLGIGDPDHPTPEYIMERMALEIRRPENHRYPADDGHPAFRQAMAAYYRDRFGVALDPVRQVLPLIGSKEGIAHISAAFVDPGDVNLVPDPGYPVYSLGTLFAGGEVYRLPLLQENGFLPRFDRVPAETACRAKILFINYPNNPTGAVAGREFFEEVVEFARRHNILVCHDAAYNELVFDGDRPVSFLEAPGALETGIEFMSLSKPFNMTGWRVACAVGNAEAIAVLGRFKTNIDSGVFTAVQQAGVEALSNPARDPFILAQRARYQERRDIVVEALRKLGWPLEAPRGSFYVWAPVPPGFTSKEFVSAVLDKTGLVVTPGRGFGEYGEGYFRIALTVEAGRMREAMERLGRAFTYRG